jgi:putative SOS response-associated peptidase YedK
MADPDAGRSAVCLRRPVAYTTRMETPVTSCTIITAQSIAPISQIHDRMPLILDPEVFDAWLNPKTPTENLQGILGHHLDGQMQMHRVSRNINSSRFTEQPAPIVNSL